MSRARNIKPGFFKNEFLVELPFETRLLFIGLWTVADRDGRLEDRPTKIKMEIFPADNVDVEKAIQGLADRGFIARYQVDGQRLIQILAWSKHQNPHPREAASVLPPVQGNAKDIPRKEQGNAKDMPSRAGSSDSLIPDSNEEKTMSAGADDSSLEQQDHDGEQVTRVIPVKAILAAYAKHLPMLPQVRVMTEPRKRKLKARWCEDAERQTVDWWANYFGYVAKSDFLTGRDGRWPGCDFEWLIEASNHVKVIEGKYENREAA